MRCIHILTYSGDNEKAFPKSIEQSTRISYTRIRRRMMSMPNDKDRDLGPEEGPDEKKYSFLQETIKTKPISREQFVKQLARFALYGIILGVFACLGFFALKPWIEDWSRGDPDTVTIPEDEESEDESDPEQEDSVPAANAGSYEEMMAGMNERAAEARKGIVTVEPVQEEEDWQAEMTGISTGAAGVITADNGQELLILADDFVCENASEWTVIFQDGKEYRSFLKMRDENSGLAIFSVYRAAIKESTWSEVKVSDLGNSNLVKQGDTVMALGNLFGYADGMGYGTVTSTDYKTTFFDGECDILATNIPTESQGTGVLFNMEGQVIGLIPETVWNDSASSVVNACAVSDLKPIIELLANGERVPYIGVYGTTVTPQLKEEQGMPGGVYVVDVDPDYPAMAAGIQSGDIIYAVNNKNVMNIGSYQSAILEMKTGQQILIEGRRIGAEGYVDVDFAVTVGSRE